MPTTTSRAFHPHDLKPSEVICGLIDSDAAGDLSAQGRAQIIERSHRRTFLFLSREKTRIHVPVCSEADNPRLFSDCRGAPGFRGTTAAALTAYGPRHRACFPARADCRRM